MDQFTKHRANRRQVVGTVAASAAALGISRVSAQDASPMASPAASPAAGFRMSKVAERASGEITFTSWDDAEGQKKIVEAIGRFNSHYPNIKVNFQPVPADYLTKIQTDIASGNPADIYQIQNEYAQDFMSRDVLLPIDDYMKEDGVTADEFFQPLIDAYTWKGKLYGLPKDWSPVCAVYDPEVLKTAGVESFPGTWDEFKAALQKIKDSTGAPGMAIDPAFDTFVAFLYQAGGNILNKDASEIVLDSDATTQALDFFYGLYKDGLISPSADLGAQWPGDAYAQGLAPIVFQGNWMFPFLALNAPDRTFAVSQLPSGPAGKGTPAFTVAHSITAASKNPDAAWVFVNYMTGYEQAEMANKTGLAVPSRKDLEPEYQQLFPERAPYIEAGTYSTPLQYGPGGQKFAQDANAILQSLWAGQVDVATAKKQLVDAAHTDIAPAQ